jgi:hypothetical protein
MPPRKPINPPHVSNIRLSQSQVHTPSVSDSERTVHFALGSRVSAYCMTSGSLRIALIRFAARPVVRLADHGGITVRRRILLGRVKTWVQDTVGVICGVREGTHRRSGASSLRTAHCNRCPSTVTAAWWAVLVFTPGRLSLEKESVHGPRKSASTLRNNRLLKAAVVQVSPRDISRDIF